MASNETRTASYKYVISHESGFLKDASDDLRIQCRPHITYSITIASS